MFDCFTEPPVAHVQNNDDDDGGPVEGQGIMGESVLAKKKMIRGEIISYFTSYPNVLGDSIMSLNYNRSAIQNRSSRCSSLR